MEFFRDEFLSLPGPGALVVGLRLLGAALVCALIGLERELTDHEAGMRTNMLVGFASATFALATEGIVANASGDVIRADPTRLIEAVTSGVAFLAAGLIVLSKGQVRGLTTGASIWLSAAAGLSIGLGQWILGLFAGLGGVAILMLVRYIELRLGTKDPR